MCCIEEAGQGLLGTGDGCATICLFADVEASPLIEMIEQYNGQNGFREIIFKPRGSQQQDLGYG